MIRIRVKMGPRRNNNNLNSAVNSREWTCCFGLHVHTATIMIGLWHLFLNILALSLLAVIWRNPHMVEELENSYDYSVDFNAPALPTPLSKVDPPYAYRDHSLSYRRQYQNFDMGGLVCTCMIAITLMMIYGTIKGKPSHLLPFFCLQLFDFAITTLTAAGYLCYLQAIHRLIAESHRLPWREKLLELSPEELVVLVLVVFVCIVFLKAYAIGIVWRCYKYLTLRQQNMRTLLPCVIPDLASANLVAEEQRAYSTLLPNYDEAINQYMKQAPPPSYQVAMSNMHTGGGRGVGGAAGGGPGAGVGDGSGAGPSDAAGSMGRIVDIDAPVVAVAPAVAVVVNADAIMDNNNDIPNNNNTVHVNANTPPMQRNGGGGAGAVALDDDDVMINSPPPAYNDAIAAADGAAAAAAAGNGQFLPISGGNAQRINHSTNNHISQA